MDTPNQSYIKKRASTTLVATARRHRRRPPSYSVRLTDPTVRPAHVPALIRPGGAAKELAPLNLTGEPDLSAVLDAVDIDDLAGV